MKRFNDAYFRFLKRLLTGLMMLLMVPVFLQVLSRYIDVVPRYIWTEEMARFAFIWIVLVGSSIAVREGTHFKIDLFPNLSPRWAGRMDVLYGVLMLIAAAVFVVGGWAFVQFGAIQHSELAGLPMVTIFIAWPLAGVSWILFLVEHLDAHFKQAETEVRDGSV